MKNKKMKKQFHHILITSLIPTLLSCHQEKDDIKLFEKVDSKDSQVTFTNQLKESNDFGVLDYLYFYNGGGVASGDINNDGLTDLYFVSNQGENKLYLNKGGLNFEDITKKSGIEGHADWQTGVTMADVNGDGFLDIFVCAVSNYKGLKGANELYINNMNGTFTERAKEYGLNFSGFSTQAAFFDYDKDGDLDCYLLNHAVHTSRSYGRANTRGIKDIEAGDYLYENTAPLTPDGGVLSSDTYSSKTPPSGVRGAVFVDVSSEAGIFQASMGYGLGISVADINNDGWEDIYVSNDFHEDDYYYVNQKDGTFREEAKTRMGHQSRFSMGSDIADINNDGFMDLMTLDMYPEDEFVEKSSAGEDPFDIYQYKLEFGYFNQYSRNCLQLNMGGQKFIDIAPMAGVSATDWSWSTLMNDFDGDGIKDIFVANGIVKRPNDLNYMKFVMGDSPQNAQFSKREFDKKALDLMPNGKVHNYFFKGNQNLQFDDKSISWGFEEANIANGATYADLDNDGDLEIITNNINSEATIYNNQSIEKLGNNFCKIKLNGEAQNTFGIGGKVILKVNGIEQTQQLMPTRGFMSAVEPILTFGLGKNVQMIDTVKVIWESGKIQILTKVKTNATLILNESNASVVKNAGSVQNTACVNCLTFEEVSNSLNLNFTHKENQYFDFNRESLMPFKVSTEGPKIAIGDVNNDGKEDLYVGGARGQAGELFLQNSTGFINEKQIDFVKDAIFEDVDAVFLDIDNDKDLDLYVVSGGNEFSGNSIEQLDRIYRNDGKGNFTRDFTALPKMFSNKSCVKPFDFDKDGDLDLFVGGRVVPFNYGKTPTSYLLINNGKGNGSSPRFMDKTKQLAPELQTAGMVTNAIWADTDKDGDADLTVIGDWMPIQIYENNKGKLSLIDNDLSKKTGFWQGIVANDFDRDGDIDFVVGNIGLNTKFRKNPKENTLRMYVKDIDGNGSVEQILTYNRNDKWFPVATKDEMGKQIPSIIHKRFTDYSLYAGKTIDDIFYPEQLEKAEIKEVNTFESVYLENLGGNKFKSKPLPVLAQISKVMTLFLDDYDNDGIKDVFIGGNFYGSNMYQARYDASYGLILKSDGKGNFKPIIPTQSGLMLEGEVRDIQKVMVNKLPYYLIARNNTALQVFKKK
jgi:enediyne biosynthesis protein E4